MQKPTTTEIAAKGGKSGMSLFLVTVFMATVAWFVWWGLGYTGFNHPFVFILACAFGLFMAFNIGGNDVANSFGTSVGAGTLSITQALIVAALFEVSGALIAGKEVTDTISKGIVDLSAIDIQPMQFVFVMMSALIAAADGYHDLYTIMQQAPRNLKPNGWLLMEHGWQQGEKLRARATSSGDWHNIATHQDYAGRDRITEMQKRG